MESIIILSVRSKEGTVPLVVIDGESDGKKTKYTITEGTYREIGCPLSGEVLEDEEAELLVKRDEERRALAKALSILAYADNGEKQQGGKNGNLAACIIALHISFRITFCIALLLGTL